ncbi:3'-5' exonuclease [Marinobacter nauticus]|uniref:3'-5' exonuclease n=1 Tax=Marinobacter nauticus TaxID=2743 RepID=UPI001F2BAF2C|nr:3'-5' exonuclease [Marinobacter nauticus]
MPTSTLLIIDLEATCRENRQAPNGEAQSNDNMEIIEIGCALATREAVLLDTRSFLVRPIRHPVLSEFCTGLTSITQEVVDEAPAFPGAIQAMNAWLGDLPDNFIWCSWGNYDRLHLEAQSQEHDARPAVLAFPHLNLKRIWRRTTGQKRKNGFAHALAFHGLEFEGHHHRGVDDARNMTRVLPYMDWSMENELLTPPESLPLKGCIQSKKVVTIEEMDRAIRDKAGS